MVDFKKRLSDARRQRVDREYRELKAADPDLFRACIESTEGIVLNEHQVFSAMAPEDKSRIAAAIECAVVSIAVLARSKA